MSVPVFDGGAFDGRAVDGGTFDTGGLRGGDPAGAGLLRGALGAHGPGGRGAAFRPVRDRHFTAAGVETVVVNAAGCGSMMKEYEHLLRDDPHDAERAREFSGGVRDVSEVLAELGPVAPRHPLEVRIAYHDACHLGHAQGVRSQPRELLRAIPGLELAEIAEADICCGSAGVYNLLHPEPATELGSARPATCWTPGRSCWSPPTLAA